MKIEVSAGECFDKYSILDLKASRISDAEKRKDVENEMAALSIMRPLLEAHPFLYSLLRETNGIIWDLTDDIKTRTTPDAPYAQIARRIFDENQTRFRIKSMINALTTSELKERKSYVDSEIAVEVTDLAVAVPVLWSLALLYDRVWVTGFHCTFLQGMFRTPNFSFGLRQGARSDTSFSARSLTHHNPPPLRYVSGGRLGDFIHQLSVVYEMFLKTGRKGILYMAERSIGADVFARGIVATRTDLLPILGPLPYIESLEIYAGQPFDIHLSAWRNVPDLYTKSWQEIYGMVYDVPWGSHPWLTSPIRSDLASTTLICTSPARWPTGILWSEFLKTISGPVLFLRVSEDDYRHFCHHTGVILPTLDAPSFSDVVIAIHSCRKFIGTLSLPLAVADALKKDRLALTQTGTADERIAIRTNPSYLSSA